MEGQLKKACIHRHSSAIPLVSLPHEMKAGIASDGGNELRPKAFHTQGLRGHLGGHSASLKAHSKPADRSQSTSQTDQALQSPPAWINSPIFFLLASTGYAAITSDLFAPWGSRYIIFLTSVNARTDLDLFDLAAGVAKSVVEMPPNQQCLL